VADLLGEELVERDVAVGAVLRLGVEHAGEEGVHREVAAFDAVVEAAEDRQVLSLLPERLEQGGLLVVLAGGGREEFLGLVAQQVADRDEASGADAGSLGEPGRSGCR
jgi:dihydropteroate synthase